MIVVHAPDVTDRFTTNFIRRTAKALIEYGVFPRDELDDVIQELRLGLVEQAKNFDPDRARWSTFVKTVVRLTAISLRRRQQAERRQAESEVASLNVLITDEDGQLAEIGATVSEEEYRTGLGLGFVSHTEQVHLAIDVQNVVDSLPAELQEICDLLPSKYLYEVANEMGIARSTLVRRMNELRERFREADLERAA